MSVWRSAVLAVLPVSLLGACPSSSAEEPIACTEIGCNDGVGLTVDAAPNAWLPGDYTVEVLADRASHTCSGTVPTSEQRIESVTFECDGNSVRAALIRTEDCGPEHKATVERVVCGTLELEVHGTPSSVHLQVRFDGQTVLSETSEPQYRKLQPNGPECEPICERSSAEWALPD